MVFMNLAEETQPLSASQVARRMAERGVLVGISGARRFRLVTHYWIDDAGVDRALRAFAEVL
jgi:threonine aldolase